MTRGDYTVKKGERFSRPQTGCHLLNSPWAGIIKLFPARESLVSDIPAGDGKIANLFLQCIQFNFFALFVLKIHTKNTEWSDCIDTIKISRYFERRNIILSSSGKNSKASIFHFHLLNQ
jgi:hypothetical protein